MTDPTPAELRVLLLAPTARDAAAAGRVLAAAGVDAVPCRNLPHLCDELAAGAAAAVLPQEQVLADAAGRLAAWVRGQPPWSVLPLVVLAPPGDAPPRVAAALDAVGPMTLLPRPFPVRALVSAVRAAVRDRRRQYATREHLAELERQAAALRAADRQKDEFLATLAHELRNPLAPLRNGLALLAAPHLPADRAGPVRDMMGRQIGHMCRLVDDLLDVSRVSRGLVELRFERVPVGRVVEAAVDLARPVVERAGHTLSVGLPDAPLWLDADPDRLAQVVGNLLTNAAKYTPSGGRIRLTAGVEGGQVVVRVADTGLGIPADMLPRVFDLFTQVADHAHHAQGGLGIGLALVRRLAGLHCGSVSADSPGPGQGSTFTLRLPLAADPASRGRESPEAKAVTHPPGADAPGSPAGKRVLIVDDNADAAESLALLLSLSKHVTRLAHTGPDALVAAREFRPEVVFLDIGLPGMSGHEVARALRADPLTGGGVLVALTGRGGDDDRRLSREAGFDHHLVKPVEAADLAGVLGRRPSG